jgi:hypothetical protein
MVSFVTPNGASSCCTTKALHGNRFDGHPLGPVLAHLLRTTCVEPRRIHVESLSAIISGTFRVRIRAKYAAPRRTPSAT